MKPAAFAYHRPETLPDALEALATLEDAKVLAGGQSLMPMMNFRLVMPAHVVDINRLGELAEIREDGDKLIIGAMARQRDLEGSTLIRNRCPLLWEALTHVGHPQTRNRGTIGGSLSHLDPAAELPAVLSAHDAVLRVESRRDRREVPMSEWARGYMTPNLEPDELLTDISLPLWPAGHGFAFLEMARRHGDFALAGVAALLALDASARISRTAIAVTGVDVAPVRLGEAERILVGEIPSYALFQAAAATADTVKGLSDVHAAEAYRRRLAMVLTRRALIRALDRARGSENG